MHTLPRRLLLDHFHGVVLADERHTPIDFVIDRETGWPVGLLPRMAIGAVDVCLWTPQDEAGALQISVNPEEIDGSMHPAMLMWEGHHGPLQGQSGRDGTERAGLMACVLRVQWGRRDGRMYEPVEIAHPHPFAKGERAIIRAANAHADLIDALASTLANSVQSSARLVGVDEWGMTVRCRAGLFRAAFDEPRLDEEAARIATVSMLNAHNF